MLTHEQALKQIKEQLDLRLKGKQGSGNTLHNILSILDQTEIKEDP